MRFDPAPARRNVEKLWTLRAQFGWERSAVHVYLNDIVSDRYSLVQRFQLLRDELQLASTAKTDMAACGADFSLPSVLTTVAKTNCGDRIHQGEATQNYVRLVAGRFATMSEVGELKLEAFSPTGGGTDDGATLAHVTIAHHIDAVLREMIYRGNAASFVLAGIDLQTHVGRMDEAGTITFGLTRESPFRAPRAACGALVGCLRSYNPANRVHRRIRHDLGEANFELLSTRGVRSAEGIDIAPVVGAAIVAVQGMEKTLHALADEVDERGLGHCTASITVNRPAMDDTLIYLARGTVFHGEIREQGLGTDASKYAGRIVTHRADRRLVLSYDGHEGEDFPVRAETYPVTNVEHHAEGAIDI